MAIGDPIQIPDIPRQPVRLETKRRITEIELYIEKNTQRTVAARWEWGIKEDDAGYHTASYNIQWRFYTGDGIAYDGGSQTIDKPGIHTTTYDPPENAKHVKFRIKPISKTHTVNGKSTSYWSSEWSSSWEEAPDFYLDKNVLPPSESPVPNDISLNGFYLTVNVVVDDSNTTGGYFQLVIGDTVNAGVSPYIAKTKTGLISHTFQVSTGNSYKVRFKSYNEFSNLDGGWSAYSNEILTAPAPITNITGKANSETSAMIMWNSNPTGVVEYEIEYTTNYEYFDVSGEVTSVTFENIKNYYIITGLTTGSKYFFRMRVKNDNGVSPWSNIVDIIIGSIPAAPTTWSSRSTVRAGETVTLYWMHNSVDGSSETAAIISFLYNGKPNSKYPDITIYPNNEPDQNGISEYTFQTNSVNITEDVTIQWKVKTKGILPSYGDWSTQRSFNVLVPITSYINVYKTLKWFWDPFNFTQDTIYTAKGDYADSYLDDPIIKSFPIFIVGSTTPNNVPPINARFTISPTVSYQTIDNTGEEIWINEGDVIYFKDVDINRYMSKTVTTYDCPIALLPSDIILENGINYRVVFSATMANGLTTESEYIFVVSMDRDVYDLNAEIGYDQNTASVYVQPYCVDENQEIVPNIMLSVYRLDFDGKFVEIVRNIYNKNRTTVTDPHPPLDYARYRLVGMSLITGSIFFTDLPPYPTQEKSIIIQWDEKWRNFDTQEESEMAESVITGSILRLPYNITTSEDSSPDVELVEYVGRENPVSYYGTHIGRTATWSVDIVRDDVETLYALRRLSRYMGDAYVREPNGTGYWANVTVSLNIENKSVIIPVTISIKRVEGGI